MTAALLHKAFDSSAFDFLQAIPWGSDANQSRESVYTTTEFSLGADQTVQYCSVVLLTVSRRTPRSRSWGTASSSMRPALSRSP